LLYFTSDTKASYLIHIGLMTEIHPTEPIADSSSEISALFREGRQSVFKNFKRGDKGFTLVEILVVLFIIAIVTSIAIPAALQQRHKSVDATMKADLLKVSTGLETALSGWKGVPPADIPLTFVAPTWSVVNGGTTIISGTASSGNTISGELWADGSYCAQVANPDGSNNWIYRSDTQQITTTTCPGTALGGLGSLPTSTTVTLPTAPGNLTAANTASVDNSVDVSWTAVSGATGYAVSITGVAPVTVAGTSTTIPNVNGGDTTVVVRALNSSGSGLASSTSLIVNGGTLFTSGLTTPLSTAAGSATLSRIQFGSIGLGLGGSSLTSDAATIKFATNAAQATGAWIAGRTDGGINWYTQNAGGAVILNLSLTTAGLVSVTDFDVSSPTSATSTTTGAFNVVGGAGIQGALWVGGLLTATNGISTGVPVTTTTNYTMLSINSSIIVNNSSATTLTLLSPASNIGRMIYIKSISGGTVVSASSNVVPVGTATAGTAILAAGPKWAMLQSDGTNWVIMAGN
jgi:prepilin-type N-terminal cleavage/methylation domain-containing protein